MKTDRLLADTKTIRYEETDLASLISAPYHFRCGIYLICTQGEAVVSTGVQKYIFNEQTVGKDCHCDERKHSVDGICGNAGKRVKNQAAEPGMSGFLQIEFRA